MSQTEYWTTTEAARDRKVCEQRIRCLLKQKRIPGAKRHGNVWMIPKGFTVLPAERRKRALERAGG